MKLADEGDAGAGELFKDVGPPGWVHVSAGTAKNGKEADVPFGRELATALRAYIAERELGPGDRLLPVPAHRLSVTRMLYRDLRLARIKRECPETGKVVDFHALRATAITWWLTEYGLTVRETSELARASMRIVERYAKGFRLRSFAWMEKGPRFGAGNGQGRLWGQAESA